MNTSDKGRSAALVAAGLAREVFGHIDPDGRETNYDITTLRKRVEACRSVAPPERVPMEEIPYDEILASRVYSMARAAEITPEQLDDPIIFMQDNDGTVLMLDGIHRLIARRVRGCTDVLVYVVPTALVNVIPNDAVAGHGPHEWGDNLYEKHEAAYGRGRTNAAS